MVKINLNFFISILGVLVFGCAPKMVKHSSYSPSLIQRGDEKLTVHSSSEFPDFSNKKQKYIELKEIVIQENPVESQSGSLFQLNNRKNYLFAKVAPYKIGRFVDLDVELAQKNSEKILDSQKNSEEELEKPEQDELKKLLQEFPDLKPANPEQRILGKLRMIIAHRYPNGDLKLRYERNSTSGVESKSVVLEGRLPFEILAKKDTYSTKDLIHLEMNQIKNGSLKERSSVAWEDEYILHLSNFEEASSKEALKIEQSRKDLEVIKKQLREQILAFGKKQKTIAKERDDFVIERKDDRKKIDKLKETLKQKENDLAEKNKLLEELQKSEENPIEENDGDSSE